MKNKLQGFTCWFPAHINPVRPGVYERDYSDYSSEHEYQYWDGTKWYYGTESTEMTALLYQMNKRIQVCKAERQWRGLSSPT